MPVNNGDKIRVTMKYQMPSAAVANNVFYFRSNNVATISDLQATVDFENWGAVWATVWSSYTSNNIVCSSLDLHVLDANLDWQPIGTAIIGISGVSLSDMLPHGVCGLLRAPTGFKRSQGKKYIPGITEGAQDNGEWDTVALAVLGQQGEIYLSDPETFLGISNSYTPGVVPEGTNQFRPFGPTVLVNAFCSYQRRRRPGVGT